MPFTSSHLVKAVMLDTFDRLTPGALADYGFKPSFYSDKEDDELITLFGVYQDLVKHKGVDEKLLHKCFLSGQLNELVDKKNTNRPSGYYLKMKEKGWKIVTCIDMCGEDFQEEYKNKIEIEEDTVQAVVGSDEEEEDDEEEDVA